MRMPTHHVREDERFAMSYEYRISNWQESVQLERLSLSPGTSLCCKWARRRPTAFSQLIKLGACCFDSRYWKSSWLPRMQRSQNPPELSVSPYLPTRVCESTSWRSDSPCQSVSWPQVEAAEGFASWVLFWVWITNFSNYDLSFFLFSLHYI